MTYEEAELEMKAGGTVSVEDGEFDYYTMNDGTLYGSFSTGHREKVNQDELEVIKDRRWYKI